MATFAKARCVETTLDEEISPLLAVQRIGVVGVGGRTLSRPAPFAEVRVAPQARSCTAIFLPSAQTMSCYSASHTVSS